MTCACLYLFSFSAVLNPYTRIYAVIVLVVQCLQTSHSTLNSTEYLLGSTTVVNTTDVACYAQSPDRILPFI